MIGNLSRLLGCDESAINLTGKTHEKVDAVGEGRAIEVHAVALLRRA
jgi:2C-methyl-D-erythritol 2,4-cyclodiphosphate synthase